MMTDPKVKDRKKMKYDNTFQVLPLFLFNLFIVTPIILFVLVPCFITCFIINFIIKKIKKIIGIDNNKRNNLGENEPLSNSISSLLQPPSQDSRKFDIIIFGATGYTGKMCAIYMAKQYGMDKNIKWAIAGRRKSALEDIRNELLVHDKELINLPVVIADSSDFSSLTTMCASTKVIITTAGPFAVYGNQLVKACAELGTHYCDITGETDWVRTMIDKYDDVAKKTGAKIVHFCGHDCIPWDLCVLKIANEMKKKGETLSKVNCYDEIIAQASGGTMATAMNALTNRIQYKSSLGFDPLVKSLTGDKSENIFRVSNCSFLSYSKEYKSWTGPFVMAMVMANCVRRSNSINNYSKKMTYSEMQVYPSFMAGYIEVVQLMCLGLMIMTPPLRLILTTFILPKPGQGPTESELDKGFLKVTAIGESDSGTKATAMIYFPTDPGYRDTARMLVESGLVLALDGDKLKVGGGCYTPAACQGEILIDRLVATGSSFTFKME